MTHLATVKLRADRLASRRNRALARFAKLFGVPFVGLSLALSFASMAFAHDEGWVLAQEAPPSAEKQAPAPAPDASKPTATESWRPNYQPGDKAARDRALGNLYAYLATAGSPQAAARIATAIERIWLDAGSETISLLMERALTAAKDQKFDDAITIMDAVIDLRPQYAEAWNRRAFIYFMRDQNARALADLQRVLALDPSHFKAMNGLAKIMLAMGNKAGALKALEQLREMYPYWPGVDSSIEELDREVNGQGI